MKVVSHKTITVEMTEKEAFQLERVLKVFRELAKGELTKEGDPYLELASDLLITLSKEVVRKI